MANLNETITQLQALERISQPPTALRDLFFPRVVNFTTEEVEWDYRKGGKRIAPYVTDGFGRGINVAREGFETLKYRPLMKAPSRPLTKDQLTGRGFGENVYSTKTPAQKAAEIRAKDLIDLRSMITRSEEKEAADFLTNRSYVVKGYVDDGVNFVENTVSFPGDGLLTLTGADTWDNATADIPAHIQTGLDKVIASAENPSSIVAICSPNVKKYLLNNVNFMKFYDYRNVNVGNLAPKLITKPGFGYFGDYQGLEIYTYAGQYEDFDKTIKSYIPDDFFILGIPNQGRRLYGAITQLEQNGKWFSYEGSYVPKYWIDVANDVEMLRVASRGLIAPLDGDDFYTIKVK